MKVSVIIPAYNSAKTIRKAVNSVIKQTYTNIEVIIIDDGSFDNTKEVLKEFTDAEINYFYQENKGVSVARNKGIELSMGDYLFFLDSDDYLDLDLIEKMVELIKRHDLDMVVCSHIEENSTRFKGNNNIVEGFIANTPHAISKHFLDVFPQSAAAKLFRREIITKNDISFPNNMNLGEDLYFTYSFIKYLSSYGKISDSYYHIQNVNPNSLSKKYVPNIQNDIKEQYMLWESLILKYPEIDKYYHLKKIDFRYYLLSIFINNFYKIGCPLSEKEKQIEISKFIQENPDWFDLIEGKEKLPKNILEFFVYAILRTKNITLMCSFFKLKEFLKNIKRKNG